MTAQILMVSMLAFLILKNGNNALITQERTVATALWDVAWFLLQGLCPRTPTRNYRSLTLFILNAMRSKKQKFLAFPFFKKGTKRA